jgi:general secretion pathway protein D
MMKKITLIILALCFVLIPIKSSFAQDAESVKDFLEQVLPSQPGRKIVLNSATGMLTVTDTPSNHKLIRELLEKWDVGPRQISIEARFMEVSEGALNELGIEWYGTRSDTQYQVGDERRRKEHDFFIGQGPQLVEQIGVDPTATIRPPSYDSSTSDASEAFDYRYNEWSTPPWSGTEWGAPADPAGLGLWFGKSYLSGTELYAYLRALESENKASLLSAPRVTTLSGQMANIELAITQPYASEVNLTDTGASSFGQYQTYEIEEKKTGIFLEVTPSVAEGGNIITLDLHPEVSEIVRKVNLSTSVQFPDYLGWPIIDTRSTQTTVAVRSGQTIVIGGLMQEEDITINRQVPILGNIPLLRNLFKYKYEEKEKTNLVIFLKATLISADGKEVK